MAVFRRGRIFWFEFVFAGKRIRESAKTTRKTIAVEAEKRRRLELEKALAGIPVEQRENRIRSVADVVKAYLEDYKLGHREKSILFAENRLAHVSRLLGTTLLPDVNEQCVRWYMTKRLADGASGRTINAEVGELSRAIGKPWSVLWGKVRKLEERDVGRALSADEESRLLAAAGKNQRSPMVGTFLRVALLTGMRYGEIAGLQWGRVDMVRRLLTVGTSKTAAGTGRVIPMGRDLASILEMHAEWFRARFGAPEPSHYLFPFGSPLPIDPKKPTTSIKTVWARIRSAAGVECRLHDLRHTAATKMAEGGVPESTMLALMGHMSRKMLERYSHVRLASKRDAVEAMSLCREENGQSEDGVPPKVPTMDKTRAVN